jgi:hypothetical protein
MGPDSTAASTTNLPKIYHPVTFFRLAGLYWNRGGTVRLQKAVRSRRKGQATIEYLLMLAVAVGEIVVLYPVMVNGFVKIFANIQTAVTSSMPLP